VHIAGLSVAHRAVAIGDCGLRDGTKQEPPHYLEPHERRQHVRHDAETQHPRSRAGTRHARERAIGRGDEPPGERHPLRLEGVEERRGGAAVEHRGEFPRQVDRISDARVHPLPAHRAVDVRGIAEEERASRPESVRDAVMHAVCRKPVHTRDVDTHPVDDVPCHVVPRQRILGVA
jgi:hypothetical protein